MSSYDDSVQALYRAPIAEFVEERKRLGRELAANDLGASKLFLKLPRPSVSAWATNQLYWQEPDELRELFATAERLRTGELDATAAHRQVTNRLVTRAAELLRAGGHAASEATLRKVSANLAALAAAGGFDPDLPGAMRSDRDPPGFGALEGATFPAAPVETTGAAPSPRSNAADEARARAEAERKRVAEEQARLRAEQKNVESALRAATAAVESRTRDKERLSAELASVEGELALAEAQLARLSARSKELASLFETNGEPADHA